MDKHSIRRDEWEHLIQLNSVNEDKWSVVTKLALELMAHTGLRTSEIALLNIGDLLSSDNKIKSMLIVPASISFNGKDRPVSLGNKALIDSLILYFDLLANLKNIEISTVSPLLLNPTSVKGFDVHKRGKKANGKPKYFSIGLNTFIDNALSKCVIDGTTFTRKSLINTFISNSYRNGFSIEEISLMSGMGQPFVCKVLINADKSHSGLIGWWNNILKSNTVRLSFKKSVPLQSIINGVGFESEVIKHDYDL